MTAEVTATVAAKVAATVAAKMKALLHHASEWFSQCGLVSVV